MQVAMDTRLRTTGVSPRESGPMSRGSLRGRTAREGGAGIRFGNNDRQKKSKHQHSQQDDDDEVPAPEAHFCPRVDRHEVPGLRVGIDGTHEKSSPLPYRKIADYLPSRKF